MAEVREAAREVHLRAVEDQDVDAFFDHQADQEATEMAAFPARGREQFAAHWAKAPPPDDGIERAHLRARRVGPRSK